MHRQSRPIVLLTRPKAQSERFAAQIDREGAQIVIAPLMEITAVAADFPAHDGDLVVTSENALRTLPDVYRKPGTVVWCVGRRTADVAQDLGFEAISADGNADDLYDLLMQRETPRPLLHLTGEHQASQRLQDIPGLKQVVTYRQEALPPDPHVAEYLRGEVPLIVPLFSPRSARLFWQAYPTHQAEMHVVAISAAVAEACTETSATKIVIAARPDGDNMKKMVADLVQVIGKRVTQTGDSR